MPSPVFVTVTIVVGIISGGGREGGGGRGGGGGAVEGEGSVDVGIFYSILKAERLD